MEELLTRLKIPEGLPQVLDALARGIIRQQPEDLYSFAADLCQQLWDDECRKENKSISAPLPIPTVPPHVPNEDSEPLLAAEESTQSAQPLDTVRNEEFDHLGQEDATESPRLSPEGPDDAIEKPKSALSTIAKLKTLESPRSVVLVSRPASAASVGSQLRQTMLSRPASVESRVIKTGSRPVSADIGRTSVGGIRSLAASPTSPLPEGALASSAIAEQAKLLDDGNAAVRIQAAYRGYRTRRSLATKPEITDTGKIESDGISNPAEDLELPQEEGRRGEEAAEDADAEPAVENVEAGHGADGALEENGATESPGEIVEKEAAEELNEIGSEVSEPVLERAPTADEEEEIWRKIQRDISLEEETQTQAATKIQASFRGFRVRRELNAAKLEREDDVEARDNVLAEANEEQVFGDDRTSGEGEEGDAVNLTDSLLLAEQNSDEIKAETFEITQQDPVTEIDEKMEDAVLEEQDAVNADTNQQNETETLSEPNDETFDENTKTEDDRGEEMIEKNQESEDFEKSMNQGEDKHEGMGEEVGIDVLPDLENVVDSLNVESTELELIPEESKEEESAIRETATPSTQALDEEPNIKEQEIANSDGTPELCNDTGIEDAISLAPVDILDNAEVDAVETSSTVEVDEVAEDKEMEAEGDLETATEPSSEIIENLVSPIQEDTDEQETKLYEEMIDRKDDAENVQQDAAEIVEEASTTGQDEEISPESGIANQEPVLGEQLPVEMLSEIVEDVAVISDEEQENITENIVDEELILGDNSPEEPKETLQEDTEQGRITDEAMLANDQFEPVTGAEIRSPTVEPEDGSIPKEVLSEDLVANMLVEDDLNMEVNASRAESANVEDVISVDEGKALNEELIEEALSTPREEPLVNITEDAIVVEAATNQDEHIDIVDTISEDAGETLNGDFNEEPPNTLPEELLISMIEEDALETATSQRSNSLCDSSREPVDESNPFHEKAEEESNEEVLNEEPQNTPTDDPSADHHDDSAVVVEASLQENVLTADSNPGTVAELNEDPELPNNVADDSEVPPPEYISETTEPDPVEIVHNTETLSPVPVEIVPGTEALSPVPLEIDQPREEEASLAEFDVTQQENASLLQVEDTTVTKTGEETMLLIHETEAGDGENLVAAIVSEEDEMAHVETPRNGQVTSETQDDDTVENGIQGVPETVQSEDSTETTVDFKGFEDEHETKEGESSLLCEEPSDSVPIESEIEPTQSEDAENHDVLEESLIITSEVEDLLDIRPELVSIEDNSLIAAQDLSDNTKAAQDVVEAAEESLDPIMAELLKTGNDSNPETDEPLSSPIQIAEENAPDEVQDKAELLNVEEEQLEVDDNSELLSRVVTLENGAEILVIHHGEEGEAEMNKDAAPAANDEVDEGILEKDEESPVVDEALASLTETIAKVAMFLTSPTAIPTPNDDAAGEVSSPLIEEKMVQDSLQSLPPASVPQDAVDTEKPCSSLVDDERSMELVIQSTEDDNAGIVEASYSPRCSPIDEAVVLANQHKILDKIGEVQHVLGEFTCVIEDLSDNPPIALDTMVTDLDDPEWSDCSDTHSHQDSRSASPFTMQYLDPYYDGAATKIQANYRGYRTRQNLKRRKCLKGSDPSQNNLTDFDNATNSSVASMIPEADSDSDSHVTIGSEGSDLMNSAATRIQARYRGYRVRQELLHQRLNGPTWTELQSKARSSLDAKHDHVEWDPDTAATKIQAGVRGFLVRRRQGKLKLPSQKESVCSNGTSVGASPKCVSLPRGFEYRRGSLPEFQRKRFQKLTAEERRGSAPFVGLLTRTDSDPTRKVAALRIQSAFRGYRVRKRIRQEASPCQEYSAESAEDVEADEQNQDKAATKIQARYRGYRARQGLKEDKAARAVQHDEEIAKAVQTIQAGFRGYKVRKDMNLAKSRRQKDF